MDTSQIIMVAVGLFAVVLIFRVVSLALKLLIFGAIAYAGYLAYQAWFL